MLVVRKNQLFDQEWQVCQYINGEFVGIVSGMGLNPFEFRAGLKLML